MDKNNIIRTNKKKGKGALDEEREQQNRTQQRKQPS